MSDYESAASKAATDVAQFEDDRRSPIDRVRHALHVRPALVPLIVLIVAVGIFTALLGPDFFANLPLIMQQVQIVGVLAAAQTLIVLTAGIDLSVGAIAVFSSVIMGQFTFRYFIPGAEALFDCVVSTNERDIAAAMEAGLSGPCWGGLGNLLGLFSIVSALAFGTGVGAVSGWLVSRVKLPPFIVTLGMWQMVLAGNYIFSRNETIRSRDIDEAAPILRWLGVKPNEQLVTWIEGLRGITYERRRPSDTDQPLLDLLWAANITYGVVIMIILVVVLAYCLRSTDWGRHVYAVGDDPDAAELAGVDRHRTLMSIYMLAGFICALAGWVMIGRFGASSPSASTGLEGNIQAITAVVIGGISLFGGRGTIWGALFGALIVGVFDLGLGMLRVNTQWTYFMIGALIIVAVAIDQWIREAK